MHPEFGIACSFIAPLFCVLSLSLWHHFNPQTISGKWLDGVLFFGRNWTIQLSFRLSSLPSIRSCIELECRREMTRTIIVIFISFSQNYTTQTIDLRTHTHTHRHSACVRSSNIVFPYLLFDSVFLSLVIISARLMRTHLPVSLLPALDVDWSVPEPGLPESNK